MIIMKIIIIIFSHSYASLWWKDKQDFLQTLAYSTIILWRKEHLRLHYCLEDNGELRKVISGSK